MAKRAKTRRTRRRNSRRDRQRSSVSVVDRLLHFQVPDDERPWKFLLPVLALAFVVRAVIALCGDFVLHPDEIMQYLEPAHRLVFGNGVSHWEYFYGARSWLVPGVVAGVLKVFDLAGFGEPFWYVGGVKLMFCAISLLVPVGMYFFARRHFGETSARVALVAGAFWYELVGFAHKPMTEFVATTLLMVLLALCVRSSVDRVRTVWLMALVGVLIAAVRLQYAPLALLFLGVFFLRTKKRVYLAVVASAFLLVVGVFDAITWDGSLFHSYITNIRFNLVLGEYLSSRPVYQFLVWLLLASVGLSALCMAMVLRDPRRYGFLLVLIGLVLLIHSVQAHKEYRFVFAVIPLWLLVGADVVAQFAARGNARVWGLAAVLFAAVSLGGILNALPFQNQVYTGMPGDSYPYKARFILAKDPIFAAYRYLAHTPGVLGVWQVDRGYAHLPGYYYLHRKIPFYDEETGGFINKDMTTISSTVSHIVSGIPNLSIPFYSVERKFGDIQIWHRDREKPAIVQWQDYHLIVVGDWAYQIMRAVDPDAPLRPANKGIRFIGQEE